MLIKSITLNNFRQYKGKQVLEFATDTQKNVTAILGANTSGKTTIVQAFNWCLYERTNFRTKELINFDIIRPNAYASFDVYVEVELIHDGLSYVIRRSQKFNKEYDKVKVEQCRFYVSYKEANGETQEVSDTDKKDIIEKILPSRLSEYFFFAGEHINEIDNRGNVVDAVRGLMGLDIISNAVDHFDPRKSSSVISKLNNSLDISQDVRSRKLKSDLAEEQDKLERLRRQGSEVKNEADRLKELIAQKDEKILANQATKEKQQNKLRLERDIVAFKERLITAEKRIIRDFSKDAIKFFSKPLFPKVIDVIANAKQEGEGVPDMYAHSIDYIITRGRCICGADLTKNQGAVEHLDYEKSLLPPAQVGTLIRTYREKCELYDAESDDYAMIIKEDYIDIRRTANMIDDMQSQLNRISDELVGDIDVGKIESERSELKKSLESRESNIAKIVYNIGQATSNIENLKRQISSLELSTEKNSRIKKSIQYAQAIYEWFKESYDKHESEVKEGLHSSINRLFSEMYHGRRIVEVDDKYKVILKVDNGDGRFEADTSKGLDAVKNFAFVTGLVDLARQKARQINSSASDEDNVYTSEPYPIVMDAAFSNTDEKHIENISKVIPKIAEQVILIVMEKDWLHAKPVLKEYLGKVYRIEKHSETSSTLRSE